MLKLRKSAFNLFSFAAGKVIVQRLDYKQLVEGRGCSHRDKWEHPEGERERAL